MILACDPGMGGGFAWTHGTTVAACKMPETTGDILTLLCEVNPQVLVLEDVPKAIFGAGPSSLAVLHRNVGFIEGCAMALGVSILRVPPKKWQKAVGMAKRPGEEQNKWKNRLKEEAQRRFPSVKVTLNNADALLIFSAHSERLNA
jgi:hypothetical protein